jgi:hypothetical protein
MLKFQSNLERILMSNVNSAHKTSCAILLYCSYRTDNNNCFPNQMSSAFLPGPGKQFLPIYDINETSDQSSKNIFFLKFFSR